MPSWNPPPGYALLDLRSIPDHAEGASGRAVFFGDGSIPSGYDSLGSGPWADIRPSGRTLAAIPRRRGFIPAGDTLRDLLLSILTDGSAPDGSDGPRPILPTVGRRVELRAVGAVHDRAFALDSSTHANRVKDVLRADFAAVHADATGGKTPDPEIHRRVLDYWCEKYGTGDWQQFVPAGLRAHIEGRLPHRTTITESFNKANGVGLGPDLSWTSVFGTWQVDSNKAGKSGTNSVVEHARADTDLSSADHYAQVAWSAGSYFAGPCARVVNSSAKTFYVLFGGSPLYLTKLVAGTQTNLTSGSSCAMNDVMQVRIDGSTLTGRINGTQVISTTDTAITGNLRTGLHLYYATTSALDSFEAADLTTITRGMPFGTRGTAFNGGRTFRGNIR
jgi:hypothetical protein